MVQVLLFIASDWIVCDLYALTCGGSQSLAIISFTIYLIAMPDQTHPSVLPSSPFEGMVCFSVYAASLAITRLYKRLLEPYGLTYPQFLVVVALAQQEDQTVSQLGEALFLESSTLTPLLKRMEAAGMVTRQRDTRDERVVRLALTPRGQEVAQEIACVPLEMLAASERELEPLQQMARELNALSAVLRRYEGIKG
jgi:DNA-binding MarR family transcriptional regulator